MSGSQISPSYFNVTFNPDNGALEYELDLHTDLNTYVTAIAQVYAYGFLIINEEINLCDMGWKQFCPVYPGSLQIQSVQYLDQKYVDMIPGIAYTVPDIDAVVKVDVYDRSTGEHLSCIQSSFTNGRTVSQTGAKWATAVVAGLGLLIAAVMSTFGNSNAASHISANAVSLFLYFQSVVVVCMQSVERVPPIASAWSENLAWSMGLIKVTFMQKIFRWYVQSSGGDPTLYLTGTTKQILVQRAVDYINTLHELARRKLDFALQSNTNLIVLRGIKRIGFNSGIEPTSIVVTGFTFFILIGYVLVGLLVIFKSILTLLSITGKLKSRRFLYFRTSFPIILKGAILRYVYIGFTQLVILSLWEFTVNDSPAVIVLAVLFLLLPLTLLGYSFWKVLRFGRLSIRKYNNPAAILYGDNAVLNKYGFCYTMFQADKYWFGVVVIGYSLVKGIFIGLCQASGKTSAMVLFLLDLAFTCYLIYSKPYLNYPTNVVNYLIAVVTTINSFLFLFFSDLFGQAAPVSSIMGWIFFVLNAAFSLILLLMILVLVTFSLLSKNPDARFAPAKDDRFSFQNNKETSKFSAKNRGVESDVVEKTATSSFEDNVTHEPNTELSALGIAAQDHNNNWESEMYKLNNISGSQSQLFTPTIPQEGQFGEEAPVEKEKLGSRLKDKITRGLSIRSNKNSEAKAEKNVSRISDTLKSDDNEERDLLSHLDDGFTSSNITRHARNESRDSSLNAGPTNTRGFL